jgi:sugar/nucleoside kinase (ribokinase family)
MSAATSAAGPSSPSLLCLGEALVDLIGEEWADSAGEVARFTPHFGGTMANIAVVAARAGAPVTLAGGAGDDHWGRWLVERLRAEGVDASRFELLPGVQTQLAFVAIDREGEPTYELYGEPMETVAHAVASRVGEFVEETAGLVISSNTLAREPERAVTMRARERALQLGRPVMLDCNLRLHRWRSPAAAAAAAVACVPAALLVRANEAEAELVTGEAGPERAAAALCDAGARLVVITLGSGGAILRGAVQGEVAAATVDVISAVGAGDAFTGTLVARLALSGFDPAAVGAALGEAAEAAARACEHWGSLD